MTKKEVIMRGREAIIRDEMKMFGNEIFYDLQWNWLLID
jgi:hypothetical protein